MHLGSKFFPELRKDGYGNTRKWIQGKGQKGGRWFFPAVYEDAGIVVISVNWHKAKIEYYDPQCSSYFARERRAKLEVVSIASPAAILQETNMRLDNHKLAQEYLKYREELGIDFNSVPTAGGIRH